MPKEVLTLKKIQEIEEVERLQKRKKERKINKIGDFYNEFATFLEKMQSDYENEVKINPTSQKAIMLKENIIKGEALAKNIYEMREETIAHYALSAVRGIPEKDIDNFTKEEKELYNSLIEIFERARKEFFKERFVKKEVKKILIEEKVENSIEKQKIKPQIEEYVVVRILEDMSFVGTDERNYSLKKEDVVSLPISTGKILSKRGKGIILRI